LFIDGYGTGSNTGTVKLVVKTERDDDNDSNPSTTTDHEAGQNDVESLVGEYDNTASLDSDLSLHRFNDDPNQFVTVEPHRSPTHAASSITPLFCSKAMSRFGKVIDS
jgi:hypothetical protein